MQRFGPGQQLEIGETSKTITIPIQGDANFEPDEYFSVKLVTCNLCSIINSGSRGTAKIINDDASPLHFHK